MSVSIVTVTWNSARTIGSVIEALGGDFEVIVVDNGSRDATREIVRTHPRAKLIESERNVGFGAGCNLGAGVATGDVLVFLNPDTQAGKVAIDALVDQLEDDSIGAVLPALSRSIKDVRETVGAFPSPLFVIAQAFGLWRLAKRFLIRPGRRVRIPTGFGACIAMRREVFASVGRFDESIFLYGEDTDLCRRIHDSGRSVVLDTEVLVLHHGNESGAQAFDIRGRAALVLQANYRFLKKFHSRRYADLTFLIWRLVLPLRTRARPDFAEMHKLLKDGTWRSAEPRPPEQGVSSL